MKRRLRGFLKRVRACQMVHSLARGRLQAMTWLVTLSLWIGGGGLDAAVPHLMNLQGRLTDPSGNPITVPTQVDFQLFAGGSANDTTAGTLVYREIGTVNPSPDGTYSYQVGSGNSIGNFQLNGATVDISQPLFLQMTVSGQALLPRLQLVATPYSLAAETVADSAVTTQKIADGAITSTKFGPDAQLMLIPSGMVAIFPGGCPNGWTRFADLDNLFAMGSPNYGATGGSATHTHTLGAASDVAQNQWLFGDPQGSGSHPENFALADHTHSISTESNLPPYKAVIYCKKI